METIRDILKKGEDSYTEFKAYSTPEKYNSVSLAAEIVAFANTEGGTIYIGVDDSGKPTGIAEPDEWLKKIDNICCENIEPPIRCEQEKLLIDNDILILKVKVAKGSQRPYRADGKIYVRFASGKRLAARDEIKNIFQSAGILSSDESIVQGTSVDDIDWNYCENYFKKHYGGHISFPKNTFENNDENKKLLIRILKNMRLIEGDNLTIAGLLFFVRKPQMFIPYYKISIVVFNDNQIGETMMKQDIEGNIEKQILDVSDFFQNHIPEFIKIDGFNKENPNKILLTVLRECIVNAIIHRDYTIFSQIRIFIFNNRIEIKNPGQLLNSLTIESIKLGAHRERNPVIASIMSKLGYMTEIGAGIMRIIKLMKEQELPEPEFISENGEFQVTLWLKK
ncbi:MAG TPA: ATP-binding protein [bacterium]|nr:ATP-binding protein [bacterium]